MKTARPALRSLTALGLSVLAPLGIAVEQSTVVDAEVVDVQPVLEVLTERIPYESCRPERVFVENRNPANPVAPTVVGALLGGSVANVLGRNSSKRDVITGAGALLGGTVGYQRHQRANDESGYYATRDVCTTEYEVRERERIDGYRVSYRFGDRIYQTRSATDPGSSIAVRVSLEPVR